MAPLCFSIRLAFAAVLLRFALQSLAFPATLGDQNSLTILNATANAIRPYCYTPDSGSTPGIEPTDLEACRAALSVLVRTAGFLRRRRFSRNPRAMAVKIPIGWESTYQSNCRIVISCENDRDSGDFRYADIAQVAKRVMDNCVDHPDPSGRYPVLKWGGLAGIEGLETFYVAVARPIGRELGIEGMNGTGFAGGRLIEGGVDVLR